MDLFSYIIMEAGLLNLKCQIQFRKMLFLRRLTTIEWIYENVKALIISEIDLGNGYAIKDISQRVINSFFFGVNSF